jgi:hypothetical protein
MKHLVKRKKQHEAALHLTMSPSYLYHLAKLPFIFNKGFRNASKELYIIQQELAPQAAYYRAKNEQYNKPA